MAQSKIKPELKRKVDNRRAFKRSQAEGNSLLTTKSEAQIKCESQGGVFVNGKCEFRRKDPIQEEAKDVVELTDEQKGIVRNDQGQITGVANDGFDRGLLTEEEKKELDITLAKQEEDKLQAEKQLIEEEEAEKEELSIEQKFKQAREKLIRDRKAQEEISERTESGVISSQAVNRESGFSEAPQLKGIRRAKFEQQQQFQQLSDNLLRAREKFEASKKTKDLDERTEAIRAEREALEGLQALEQKIEQDAQEEGRQRLDFVPQSAYASMTDEEVEQLFTDAGLPGSFGIDLKQKSVQLKELNDKLLLDPTNEELLNQKAVLEGRMDDIVTQATGQTDKELEIAGLQRMLDAGIITQDQFNKGVQQEIGIEDPRSKFEFKTADGKAYVFDPQTGKTTEVRKDNQGNVSSPFIADVGTGNITQNYGTDVSSFNSIDHVPLQSGGKGTPGIDIAGNSGDPIQAFVSGTITQVAENGGYGNQIIVTDSNGNEHMYSHLRDLDVPFQVGQSIKSGDVIGFMGNSGTVFSQGEKVDNNVDKQSGSHLDYRVRSKNTINKSRWADPNGFIAREEGFDPALIPLYAKFNNGDFKSADFDAVKDLNIDLEVFKDQALASKIETDKRGAQFAKDIIDIANRLKAKEGRTGAAFGLGFVPFTDFKDFERAFANFQSKLSLQNLTDLKANGATFGALSNQELNFITSAATSLDPGMQEEDYQGELDRIIETMEKSLKDIGGEAYVEIIDAQVSDPTLNYINQLGL